MQAENGFKAKLQFIQTQRPKATVRIHGLTPSTNEGRMP